VLNRAISLYIFKKLYSFFPSFLNITVLITALVADHLGVP
jgi:hypothetical protein